MLPELAIIAGTLLVLLAVLRWAYFLGLNHGMLAAIHRMAEAGPDVELETPEPEPLPLYTNGSHHSSTRRYG